MDKDKAIKIVGTVLTLVGFGVSIIQKQLDDQKLQKKIAHEVQKHLNQK